jgi:hypothetical protein
MLKGIATRRIDSVLNSMAEMSSELQPAERKKSPPCAPPANHSNDRDRIRGKARMKHLPKRREHQKWRDLLTAVFTLCALDSRLESQTVDKLVAEARVRAGRRLASFRPGRRRTVDLDALGHVIYHWQRNAKYLDSSGKPLHIAARGPAPSVEAIFREIGRADYFESGLLHLKQVRRMKRTRRGLYAPIGEVSIVPSLTPEIAELVAQTVNRLLATVVHNTSLKVLGRSGLLSEIPRSLTFQ